MIILIYIKNVKCLKYACTCVKSVKIPTILQHLPHVDICECLRRAYRSERLTLTVPWVVEFLSMMDVIAPGIEYFQTVLLLLLLIHK